jgi:uncharacterized protein
LIAADIDSQAFFDGLDRGEVLVQHCPSCGRHQFPARVVCVRCGARGVEWSRIDGGGTLYAFTVTHRPPEAAFADLVPYAVGLVDLVEGVRVMARSLALPDRLSIGMPVEVLADPAPRLEPCLIFRPVDDQQ